MTTERALQRLFWRFGGKDKPKQRSKTTFPVNKEDMEALNAIIRAINDLKDELYDTNQGFAKLYIFALNYFIKHYKTDIYDETPQKELSRLLDRDISVLIQRFTDNLNDSEKYSLLEINESKHPALMSDKERELEYKKLHQKAKNDPEFVSRLTNDAWKFEDVEENLKQMISTALMRFKL